MHNNLASETAKVIFMAAQEMSFDVEALLKKVEEDACLHLSPEEVPEILAAVKKGAEAERNFR